MGETPGGENPDVGGNGPGGVPDPDAVPGLQGIGYQTRAPRLSFSQWENSVRDLLRLEERPGLSSTFALDPDDARFDTYMARLVSANLWADFQRAAEQVARQVASDPVKLDRLRPAAAPDDPRAFVEELGLRAFRRPLTEEEIQTYVGLFAQGPELVGGDAYASGAELVMQALLQSVHFIYRLESSTQAIDGKIWLDPFEVATRLSYALWNSTPSDALLGAAAAGELTTIQSVESWARTLLQDPKADEVIAAFHDQLLVIDQYGTIAKNEGMFPNFTDALQPVLQQEARLFVNHVATVGNGGIRELLTAPLTFVNQDTAEYYGLEGNFGSELERVELDPTKRAGFLTHIGFLSKYGSQTQSDPILRGVHISLDLLCSALPAPPPDVPPLPEIEEGQTNRMRVQESTSVLPCASCHETFINPLGFAFENYDAVGQWRDTDNGLPVDAAATYQLDGATVSYSNGVELSRILAESPTVHRCYSKHWLEYALGRLPTSEEQGAIEHLTSISVSNGALRDVLATITTLETFRARPEENAP